jgi:phage tail sheath protein FI
MAEFTAPGVYVQELPADQQAVRAVSTSNFATVGWTPRGIVNQPVLVGSLPEYLTKFGSFWDNSDMADVMTSYFKNGGGRAYVVRVVPSDATKATITVNPSLWIFTAVSEGTWGNNLRVVINGSENYYTQATATYSRYNLFVQELIEGTWTDVEAFRDLDFVNTTDANGVMTKVSQSKYIVIAESTGGVIPELESTLHEDEALGTGNAGTSQTVAVTLANPSVAVKTLKIKVDGVVVAQDNGKGVIEQVGSTFTSITGTINYSTGALSVVFTAAPATGDAIEADYYEAGASSLSYQLTGGLEGTEVTRDQVSNPALQANNRGLYALDFVDELLNIGLGDFQGNNVVHSDLISYCASRGDCFAIVDVPQGSDQAAAKDYKLNVLANQSSFYAMYWPSLRVADNLRGGIAKVISPVGHAAGRYAATDARRNVGKAPAGTIDGALQYTLGLEFPVSKAAIGAVYTSNINAIKSDPTSGIVLWGSRTGQLVGDFTQISTRRLFNFLEKSLYNASQPFVFEPLNADTFGRVTLTFEGFMGALTQQGYFASQNPDEAYRVTCDDSNNTPETIAQGLLIADILVADAIPGEFVLLRFKRNLGVIQG